MNQFSSIDLSRYVVAPLTDKEVAELQSRCDRSIHQPVRELLQTIGAPQNVCHALAKDEDQFISLQRDIPEQYCAFARDSADESVYAVDAMGNLFRFDLNESEITSIPQFLAQFVLDRIRKPTPMNKTAWHTQLAFETVDESRVLRTLSESFALTKLSGWTFEDVSPAEVATHLNKCDSVDGPTHISRQSYDGWESPIYYFNRIIPPAGILDAKALHLRFSNADLGFRLINYGVFCFEGKDEDL